MRAAYSSAEVQEVTRNRQSEAWLSQFKLQDEGIWPQWEQVIDGM